MFLRPNLQKKHVISCINSEINLQKWWEKKKRNTLSDNSREKLEKGKLWGGNTSLITDNRRRL